MEKIPRSDDPDQVTSVFEKGDEIEGRISSQRQSQTESQTKNIPVGNVAGSSSLSTSVSTVSKRKLDAHKKDSPPPPRIRLKAIAKLSPSQAL